LINVAYIKLLRPKQWIKQILIFLPLITLINEISFLKIRNLILMVLSFSLVASFVYIINDIYDSNSDRLDAIKKSRPIASGKIDSKNGIMVGITLLMVSFSILLFLPNRTWIFTLILVYISINILYSKFKLKNYRLLGILIVSIGFPIRFVIGTYILGLPFPYWGFTLISLLSLTMIAGKRYQTVKRTSIFDNQDLNSSDEQFWIFTLTLLCAMFSAIYAGFISSQDAQLIWGNTFLLLSAIPVSLCLIRYLEIVTHPVNFKLRDATESVLTDLTSLVIMCVYVLIMALGRVTNAS